MAQSRVSGVSNGVANLEAVVAQFGREVTRKLRAGDGSPEDHLRAPFERMIRAIANSLGLSITVLGEARLPDLSVRPDYAVNVGGARVGYVELKRPGYGVPGSWARPSQHDREQWKKFQLLPNVLYSDGEHFARYSFGKRQGKCARLTPALDRAGDKLRAVGTDFARVLTDFLLWEPERPRSLPELVRLVANLCRLLRDDVAVELRREQSGVSRSQTFTGLATDWRQVLFPNLGDDQFADQYAQTVTFALLLARVEGVGFHGRSVSEIARLLGKKHSLMGRALTVLTDQPEEEHSVALTTMLRVLSVVDWAEFPEDSYGMLYETFLEKYDPALRRKSGVYYTPAPLVSFMTRFVDDVLRKRLDRRLGLAERDVIVVDPAMGTGSFLAEVVNTVASTVAREEGDGAVVPSLRELSNRLIGFENQAAPYAVAELRIHSLLKKRHRAEVPAKERRFLTDTLDDPDLQLLPLGRMYEAIERSRRDANVVKREIPVMVVIGNPPYADKVRGSAPWIETPSSSRAVPSLSAFRKVGNGRLEYVLSNKYVYFWRWATWKVFDAHPLHPAGVVAMVCSAGFTTGAGFAGMREYLRRTADEGWIIDLTPEGHQPTMDTRFFRGNQQPICIAVFIRRAESNPGTPAQIHLTSVSGNVVEKIRAFDSLEVDRAEWKECMSGWSDPFRPAQRSAWNSLPALIDLFPWASPGVKPNRTWVYAPERSTLDLRWRTLVAADARTKPILFGEGRDANLRRINPGLPGYPAPTEPFSEERGDPPEPHRVGFRAFDRQWLIPDPRLIATPRPALWATQGPQQIFIVEQHTHRITEGPALVFSALLPDMDHFMGHHGGRTLPLYRTADGMVANVSPGLLKFIGEQLQVHAGVTAPDLVAYVAAVTAHRGFTKLFAEDLITPAVRIPITRDPALWTEAVEIGQEVLWLHTYGERGVDAEAGRPHRSPKLDTDRPMVQATIPDDEEGMPEQIGPDPATNTLRVGCGRIGPVSQDVWTYKVSGMWVVKHWFDYRKKNPSGNRRSPLNDIVAMTWTPAMTTELLDLLNVLGRCVALEPRQEQLLQRVMDSPLITVDDLTAGSVLPVSATARRPPKPGRPAADLFSDEPATGRPRRSH